MKRPTLASKPQPSDLLTQHASADRKPDTLTDFETVKP